MEFKIVYKIVAEKDIVPENNEKNEIESKEKYINDCLGKDEWELIVIYKGFAYFKKRKEDKDKEGEKVAVEYGMTI